jgi:ketosteroid isomerase-like protein
MRKTAMSRRTLLEAAACALATAGSIPQIASAHAETGSGLSPKTEETIRKYYTAWETKEWHPVDILLADDFTFSSPLDDHISKSAFKKGCWDTQIAFIERHDLKRVLGTGDEAFVMYVCHTTNGKTFRNVEYLRLKDQQVQAIECYFGAQNNFPSAVSGKK